MFNSVITAGEFTVGTYLLCLAVSLGCGIIAAFAASFRNRLTKSFFLSLILLPPIVTTVITMVSGNIGAGIAVAGAFSLVRFRSASGKAKEITAIFMVMTAGLTCATGYVLAAVLFTVIISALLVLLSAIPMASDREKDLRITIPETLNYSTVFEDLFREYTVSCKQVSVKTTNMGSLYRITYRVRLKKPDCEKEFIDALRCRNGNLEVMISESGERSNEL